MPKRRYTAEQAQSFVDAFNKKWCVGATFMYKCNINLADVEAVPVKTRSEAYVMCDQPVVLVDEVSGAVHLDHLDCHSVNPVEPTAVVP